MMSSQVFTWTVATVLSVLVPRYLGPEIQGQLWLAGSVWAIGGIAIMLGMSQFLQLEIARRPREGLRLIGPAIVIRLLVFVVVSVPIGIYVVWTADDRMLITIMVLTGVATLLTAWVDVLNTAFIGLERMAVTASVGAAAKVIYALAALIVMAVGGSVYGIIGVGMASSVLALIYLAHRLGTVHPIAFRGWSAYARPVVRSSVPFMATGAALVVYQQIDALVISWVAGNTTLGWYGTADALFGTSLFPATIIMATIFPSIGRFHEHDVHAMTDLVRRAFSMLLLASVPIGLGAIIIAPSVVPILYGEEFRETGTVMAVLGPVIILTFGTILFGTVAQATGRQTFWMWVLVASAALTVPLDLVLVPWARDAFDNGAIGGAVAYLVTELLQFIVGVWVIAPFLLDRRTLWPAARVLLAGGVMFAVGWPLRELVWPVPFAACAATYVLTIGVLRALTEDQRRLLDELFGRVGSGRGRS